MTFLILYSSDTGEKSSGIELQECMRCIGGRTNEKKKRFNEWKQIHFTNKQMSNRLTTDKKANYMHTQIKNVNDKSINLKTKQKTKKWLDTPSEVT